MEPESLHKEDKTGECTEEKQYIILSLIGEGAFSKVYKILREKKEEAVKILKLDADPKYLKREEDIATLIKNSKAIKDNTNIVHCFDIHCNPSGKNLEIFMELCDSDLKKVLEDLRESPEVYKTSVMIKKKFLTLEDKYLLINDILGGFRQLNSLDIMHRDIKPANILINLVENKERGPVLQAKIADFGFSRLISDESENKYTNNIGTFHYMAKELLDERSNYTSKVDVWSTGVVLYEILYNELPFLQLGESRDKVSKANWKKYVKKAEELLEFPDEKFPDTWKLKVHEGLKKLIRNMLKVDDKKRDDWNAIFIEYSKFSEELMK